jgi:DNA polymerase III subunit epsilon
MSAIAHQPSFADLGTPLHRVTFVVVDLETTGGSHEQSRITEFGAVKVRAGEILGEFQSLVDPGQPIPAGISALTGITDGLVAGRPPVEAVLPTFLEFCRGTTLVAHNARFDVGFLNANLTRLDYPRLDNPVVCTASLARRLVRDEVSNCKLATLAQFFRCLNAPVHRALADARATVEVLHGLLERAGSFGVLTLEDLVEFAKVRNTPLYKARKHLADDLPHAPGVYAFRSASGEILYVGKATDLRARVRSYFGGDMRRKIADMMKETGTIDHWVCPTPLEAAVREVRLIHAERPRFNRRSKHPERAVWVKLTAERFPRLSVVRSPRDDGATYLGPLPSRRVAEQVVEAVQDAAPIRRCTDRIGARTRFPACALKEMRRCLAPCDGTVDVDGYAPAAGAITDAMGADPRAALALLHERMTGLAAGGRFEEAASARDRLRGLVGALLRSRRLAAAAAARTLVASRPASGRREVVLVRDGALAATATCDPAEIEQAVAALLAAEPPVPEPSAEETELVVRWLEGREVRVHHCDGTFASPVAGGADLAAHDRRLARNRRATGRSAAELADKRTRRPQLVAGGH